MLKKMCLVIALSLNLQAEVRDGILDLKKRNTFVEIKNYKGVLGKLNRTICAKIRFDEGNQDGHFFSYGGGGNKGEVIDVGVESVSKGIVLRAEFGKAFLLGKSVLSPQKWYHVSLVIKDEGHVEFYLNGRLDSKGTFPINTSSMHNVKIGCDRSRDRFWSGQLDEIAIWKYALNEEQINKLINTCSPKNLIKSDSTLSSVSLRHHYSFDEASQIVNKGMDRHQAELRNIKSPTMEKTKVTQRKVKTINCNAEIDLQNGNLAWSLKSEEGIKEFRVLNSKTGVVFQVIEPMDADMYSIDLPAGISPVIVAVDGGGKVYRLKNSNKTH